MEEQVNKLIEKIENDSLQYYMFDDVLNMLKDLLVSNEEIFFFECKVCGKPFGDKLSLFDHYDLNHNNGL
jgi:hypothetical protein